MPITAVKPTDWGITDPLDQQAKALALKSNLALMGQRAATAQQQAAESGQRQESNALEIAKAKQSLNDQQILADVYRGLGRAPDGGVQAAPAPAAAGVPGGGPLVPGTIGVTSGMVGAPAPAPVAAAAPPLDPGEVLMRALKDPRGLSGPGASALLSSAMDFRAKTAAAAKDNADAASANAEASQKRNLEIFGATGGLLQLPREERAAAYPAARQRMIDAGHLSEGDVPADYASFGGDSQLMKVHLAYGTQAGIDAEKKSAADLASQKAEEARKAAKAPSELAKAQSEAVTSAPNAAGLTPDQAQQAADRAAALAQTRASQAADLLVSKGRLSVEQARLGLDQKTFDQTWGTGSAAKLDASGKPLTGDAYLAALPPGRAAQVKAFAQGQIDESDLPRGNARQPFLDAVMQYEPGFTKQIGQTRKDFGSAGKSGQNIQSLNTASVHVDQLGEAAQAMANGTFVPGNQVFNRVVSMFGGAAPTNFEGIKAAVASEMASALKGNATDQEIAANAKTVHAASSPKQLAGIIDTNLHVLGAKLNTKDEQYQAGTNGVDPKYTPVMPTAAAVYAKHGIQPIQRLAVDPNVKAYADKYFGGDTGKAQAAIAAQRAGK
jgi:hypothetical protein